MHPNPAFRQTGEQANLAFAKEIGFGMLAVNDSHGPLISHIPFILSEDGNYLEAHLVRSNPILRLLTSDQPAVLAVSGPHGYLSPDWYEVDDQVPTWNYIAVHLRGKLKRLPDDRLHDILVRLSAEMEARLAPKNPWLIKKMDQSVYTRMSRQIVPVAMDVSSIEGTWKLSQNKSDEVRLSAANALEKAGFGSEIQALARFMRSAGK